MTLVIAAIRSGSDPVAPLPAAAFHRTLEDPIYCPKCDASYNLVVDYDWAVSRHFDNESRRHLSLLRKTIFLAHTLDHRIGHYETNGVTVTSHIGPGPTVPLQPLTTLIN